MLAESPLGRSGELPVSCMASLTSSAGCTRMYPLRSRFSRSCLRATSQDLYPDTTRIGTVTPTIITSAYTQPTRCVAETWHLPDIQPLPYPSTFVRYAYHPRASHFTLGIHHHYPSA